MEEKEGGKKGGEKGGGKRKRTAKVTDTGSKKKTKTIGHDETVEFYAGEQLEELKAEKARLEEAQDAMMAVVYREEIMRKLGYFDINEGKCPITEDIQPRAMLFKTNYRSISEAEKYIEILKKTLKQF